MLLGGLTKGAGVENVTKLPWSTRQSLAVTLALVAVSIKAAIPILLAGNVREKCLLSSWFQVVALLFCYVMAQWQRGARYYCSHMNLSWRRIFLVGYLKGIPPRPLSPVRRAMAVSR